MRRGEGFLVAARFNPPCVEDDKRASYDHNPVSDHQFDHLSSLDRLWITFSRSYIYFDPVPLHLNLVRSGGIHWDLFFKIKTILPAVAIGL